MDGDYTGMWMNTVTYIIVLYELYVMDVGW